MALVSQKKNICGIFILCLLTPHHTGIAVVQEMAYLKDMQVL